MKDINMLYKWVSVILFMMLTPFCLNAQWSFRMHTSASGNCPDQGLINSIAGKINEAVPDITGFATRAECEAARAAVSYSYTLSGCTVRVTATPCVGRDVGGASVAGIGAPSVGASTQGGSFFYTNMSDAIKSWQDEQDRIDQVIGNRDPSEDVAFAATSDVAYNTALNQDIARHTYSSDSGINIGNGVFKGIPSTPLKPVGSNADKAKVLEFVGKIDESFYWHLTYHPSDIYSLLPLKYQEITGVDINVALAKDPSKRDAKEKEALENYNAFVEEVCKEIDEYSKKELAEIDATPEKKELDMAILAKSCYSDDDGSVLELTNFNVAAPEDFINRPDLKNLAEVIQMCNSIGSSYGFHCELYQNSITGELTIACEGTGDLQDWINNYANAAGMEVPQFKTIEAIATAVNNIELSTPPINITGHSLGGALAGYLGLLTGRDTYTFNAEGLSPGIIESIPNYDDSKIKAYHTSYEVLTNAQKLGNVISKHPYYELLRDAREELGNAALPVVYGDGAEGVFYDAENSSYMLKVPGQEINLNNTFNIKEYVKSLGGHKMYPVVDHFLETNKSVQMQWADITANRKALSHAFQDSSLYRQDNINIITY